MKRNTPRDRAARKLLTAGLVAIAFAAMGPPLLAKLETWRIDTAQGFAKGKRDRVVVSDSGRVRLGHALKPLGSLDAARVWDLLRAPDGVIYAATGDEGKVFRREARDDAAWTVALDAPETQVLSLATGKDEHVFAGTGPDGRVVDVTDPKHPSSQPDPKVLYIWDLAVDRSGNLYAATGPTGQLWKRSAADEKWSLVYDSAHSHLLCVAVAPDGSVYAGSDGEGIVYKVAPGGKVSVVYDAVQNEVRALAVAADGTVYAGTAAEAGGGSGRGSSLFGGNALTSALTDSESPTLRAAALGSEAKDVQKPADVSKKESDRPRSTPPGGSATPRPVTAGDNAVYRIDPDGVVREVFRARALIFALAVRGENLFAGTGPEGQLYEIRDQGREFSPIARLDHGQILALESDGDGGLLLGAGDPGGVTRLEPGYVAEGSLLSDVRDAKLISRFGAVQWRADAPPKTSVSVQVRSGNVAEPDATWSDWSAEQTDPETAHAHAPAARFAQYRIKLATKDPAVSPELTSVALRYQSANLPPEISRLDLPDVSALDGATKQTKLSIRWDVTDPNDDEMSFLLFLRKEGWPDWVRLTEQPITEKTYTWDASSVPAGRYRVKVEASDRPSNNVADASTRDRISESFIVDTEPPVVTIETSPLKATARLRDGLVRLAKASYAIDGGDWVPVFADDGLFDTSSESVTIPLPDIKPGTHILVIRATDAAGNVGTGDALLHVR
jgi:hypothetical protein